MLKDEVRLYFSYKCLEMSASGTQECYLFLGTGQKMLSDMTALANLPHSWVPGGA